MIRFRLGQSWKRESVPEQGPLDAFGLDLDGVDLLSGASEEPLARVVPALVETVHAMAILGERAGQLSLQDVQLELCLFRKSETDVELSVVSLGRPTGLARPTLTVDLAELTAATARCARTLARDLAESAPSLLASKRHKAMERQAKALEGKSRAVKPSEPGQWAYERFARDGGLGLTLSDPDARLLSWSKKSTAPLSALLVPGSLTHHGTPLGHEPILLSLLELSRTALSQSALGAIAVGSASTTAPEIFELGLELCFALRTRNHALAKNPFVEALAERCSSGLAALKIVVAPVGPAPRNSRRRESTGAPLEVQGALRRLRFEAKWEKSTPGGETAGQLTLSARGPLVATRHAAIAFSPRGEMLFRRIDTHGVSASNDGRVLCSSGSRVLLYVDRSIQATWLRDHDGVGIDSVLHRADGLLIAGLAGRGVIAFDEMTGRERWRLDPPRAQKGVFSIQGHRVLLATDSGSLYGIEIADGQIRFRVRASLPLPVPPIPMGKRALALLSRGDRAALFAIDLHTGNLAWTRELQLEKPSAPVVAFSRVFLAGRREGKALVLCFDSKGDPRFERQVPLQPDRLTVVAVGRGVVAQDGRGAAAFVSSDGQLQWVVGSDGAELPHVVAPAVSRGVVVIAGRTVRAVDPKTGRVLAELDAGSGLADLKTDQKLNIYLLDELGALRAYALTSHLAVV